MHRLVVISLNGDPLAELGREHAGGQCRYVLEITKRLAAHGWSSDVFTILDGMRARHEQVTASLAIWRVPLSGGRPFDPDLCINEIDSVSEAILNTIERELLPVDVILACYWLSGIVALRLGRHLRKRTVMSFCSLGVYKQDFAGAAAMQRRVQMEGEIAGEVDHIIAASSEEARTLETVYRADSRKISVIPRGIDLDVFRPRT